MAAPREQQSHQPGRLEIWTCLGASKGLICNCLINSGFSQVTNPGITGSNHLLPPHCETSTLSFANPDGMGINARCQPRLVNLTGVFCFLEGSFFQSGIDLSARVLKTCCPCQTMKTNQKTRGGVLRDRFRPRQMPCSGRVAGNAAWLGLSVSGCCCGRWPMSQCRPF